MNLIEGLNKNKILFSYGRNAIYCICKSLKIKNEDEILTPALDCDSTITPFILNKATLVFYKSNPYTFDIDIEDLENKITEKTKLIHIINHFGFPQPWDEIEKIKSKYGIPIIEDNAFSLFTKVSGKPLGNFGDFSIFSLYKIFDIVNGGLLINNNESIELVSPSNNHKWIHKPELFFFYKGILSLMIPDKLKKFLKKEKKFIPPMYSDKIGYPKIETRDQVLFEFSYDFLRPISKYSHMQLKKICKLNFNVFIKESRFYYYFIINSLVDIGGIKVLHPKINKETVPFCVLLLIEKNRDNIIYSLINEGFSLMAWPNFSKCSLDKIDIFKEVEIIGRKIVQININNVLMKKIDHSKYFETLMKKLKKLIEESQ